MPSFCTAYIGYSSLACLSSHIPLLVKSYFLAAADLFGHSGACMIDVFLAVKHRPYPSLHSPRHHHHPQTVWSKSLEVCGAAGRSVSRVSVPEPLQSAWSTYRCWQRVRRAANAARGWRPDIILRIVTVLKNAYPACLAPGIALCQ